MHIKYNIINNRGTRVLVQLQFKVDTVSNLQLENKYIPLHTYE